MVNYGNSSCYVCEVVKIVHNQHEKIKNNPKDIKGNPRVLTDSKIDKICNLIRCGNYVKTSVKAVGVNYNTFISCMSKGKKGVEPYEDWYERIEVAKAEAEVGMSMRIHESAEKGNIGADMWKLQRMFPNRWGNAQRQEIKVDNSQEIRIVKYSDKKENEE